MTNYRIRKLCAFFIFDGLREGLSHFSGPSRVALIYAVNSQEPAFVMDPQNLLRGHEPKLKEIYLDNGAWRTESPHIQAMTLWQQPWTEENLQLAGLISRGGRSRSLFYQMWFTEHHPNMCSIGPTERWLEHAVWLLSQDAASKDGLCSGTSEYVLQGYATHAVRDYLVDKLNAELGMDIQIRIYPILDAVLGISKTLEEGRWPRGKLVFLEPNALQGFEFDARFPYLEQPNLKNFKHVRKLLQAVEYSERKLISDGKNIVGIATDITSKYRIMADFHGGHGFLELNGEPVCSFFDGSFHSHTRKANLVQLEEILFEYAREGSDPHILFQTISAIVHSAEDQKHGCTLVIDFNDQPINISGQNLEKPLDLLKTPCLNLAKSLARLDGALHIGGDMKLYRFACILHGLSIQEEDRARGARFNSALRFTAANENMIVVVVSADRPVSVIQAGVELNAQCEWKPVSGYVPPPLTLGEWLNG